MEGSVDTVWRGQWIQYGGVSGYSMEGSVDTVWRGRGYSMEG